MGIGFYLQFPFAQHSLEAAFLVAVSCGLIGPFVITRTMAFAVHGASELAFTGAVAGLLVADNPVAGALVGALVVAALIGLLGQRASERDSTIGVILAAGLGLGVFLLGYYHGYASEALNILFGNIFGVSTGQILLLGVIAVAVAVVLIAIWRPLLFASVDPDVARARGVRTGLLGIVFLFVLAITVTLAAQVVGTLLVLSLAITPAAAAQRLSVNPVVGDGAVRRHGRRRRRRRAAAQLSVPEREAERADRGHQLRLLRGGPPRRSARVAARRGTGRCARNWQSWPMAERPDPSPGPAAAPGRGRPCSTSCSARTTSAAPRTSTPSSGPPVRPVGLTTVYRHLALLTDEGQLDALQTADGELVYRRCHSEQHHHHVVCRRCGRGSEVELPDLERWAESTAADLGYSDVTHTVEIFGVCADCRG